MNGGNTMTRFKSVVPLMIYLPPDELLLLKKFAKSNKKPVSHIAREGVKMRMSGAENQYNKGFDEGIKTAMEIAKVSKGAQMRFPSGKSFGQIVCDDMESFIRTNEKPVQRESDE